MCGGERKSSEWHDKAPQAQTRSEFIIRRATAAVAIYCWVREGKFVSNYVTIHHIFTHMLLLCEINWWKTSMGKSGN